MSDAWAELERSVHAALETYSNVHRGSGHSSLVSTRLYDRAREIVLEHLGLQARDHVVVFATPRRAQRLAALLPPGRWRGLSSADIGLPLGVRALAIESRALPPGAPLESGGGTARLVAADWVVWAQPPDRFEAGTPSIVNVLAFARGLEIVRQRPTRSGRHRRSLSRPTRSGRSVGRELLRALRQTLIGRDLCVPVLAGDVRLRPLRQRCEHPHVRSRSGMPCGGPGARGTTRSSAKRNASSPTSSALLSATSSSRRTRRKPLASWPGAWGRERSSSTPSSSTTRTSCPGGSCRAVDSCACPWIPRVSSTSTSSNRRCPARRRRRGSSP